MSDRTISVTLDLVDNVTGPLKDIMGSMDDVQTPIDVTVDTGNSKKEVGEVTKSVKETGKEADKPRRSIGWRAAPPAGNRTCTSISRGRGFWGEG